MKKLSVCKINLQKTKLSNNTNKKSERNIYVQEKKLAVTMKSLLTSARTEEAENRSDFLLGKLMFPN